MSAKQLKKKTWKTSDIALFFPISGYLYVSRFPKTRRLEKRERFLTVQGYCYKFISIICNLGNELLKLEYNSFVAYLYGLFKYKTNFFKILFVCKLKTCKACWKF